MNEQAFLDALNADPLDDVTRAVYADWLEERDDPRADYLRAELSGDESALRGWDVDEDWAFQAGRRWDVVVYSFPPTRKIALFKSVRDQRKIGITAIQALFNQPQPVVMPGVPLTLALDAVNNLRAIQELPLPGVLLRSEDTPELHVGLRPASAIHVRPPTRSMPYDIGFEDETFLRLVRVRPDRIMSTAKIIANCANARFFDALDACLGSLPLTIAAPSGPTEARELAALFANRAEVEIFYAPHGTPAAEWMDISMPQGVYTPATLAEIYPWLARVLGYFHRQPPQDPILSRVPRFQTEEILRRLAPLGNFPCCRSEDQP